jgi:hypothetical protein
LFDSDQLDTFFGVIIDDALFFLIASGLALSAADLVYRLHRQAKAKKSAENHST